jgi:IS30 family transposase
MSNLKFFEREKIEFYHRCKMKVSDIAKKINRNHSVVSRELTRNMPPGQKYYNAKLAQKLADKKATKTNIYKLDKNEDLRTYVVGQLKEDWSPEEIAGRLKKAPPIHLKGETVSHESIYLWIYEGNGHHLFRHLRRKNTPRRQKRNARKKRTKELINHRVSIHDRPEEINQRVRFGDWESDTMIFKKQKAVLSVQHERKSLLVKLHKVMNKSAVQTQEALTASIESLPEGCFKSITFDNGLEGQCHSVIKKNHGIETYFCDPFKSWQKGGVENSNGLIRQYLPRDANLDNMTAEEISVIERKLNNRPRKKLRYLTPAEFAKPEINKILVH